MITSDVELSIAMEAAVDSGLVLAKVGKEAQNNDPEGVC